MRALNIRHRITLTLIVFTPTLIFVALGWSEWANRVAVAEREASATLSVLVEHTDKVVETHQLALGHVAKTIEGMDDETIANSGELKVLMRDLSHMEQIQGIWVTSGNGRILSANFLDRVREPAVSVLDRPYFGELTRSREPFVVGATLEGRHSEAPVLPLSLRREGNDGSFAGGIHSSVSLDYLSRVWDQIAPNRRSAITLFRADGGLLARRPAVERPVRIPEDLLARASQAGAGVEHIVSPIDGGERITAFAQLDSLPMIMAYGIDMGLIGRQWLQQMAVYAIFWAFSTGLILLGIRAGLQMLRSEREAHERWRLAADNLAREAEAREKAEAGLRHAQRMEALGQVTGGVAHEFNNLMQAIRSSLYVLQTGITNPRLVEMTNALALSIERGSRLTKQLVTLARTEPLHPESSDINQLIGGMGELVANTLGPSIELDLELAPDLPPALVDPGQLELAVLNLTLNARDAMPRGGHLRLWTWLRTDEEAGEADPARWIVVSISDSGKGMPPEVLARAREPFFTTKERGKGTGLGLSMVDGMVGALGGRMEIMSTPGRGTRIDLLLPEARYPAVTQDGSDIQPARAKTADSCVLLVDDDRLVRFGIATMLRDLGYTVIEAESAKTALSLIDRGLEPDVIVTDHAMPGMTGAAMAADLAERPEQAKIPVLIITGYAEEIFEEVGRDRAAILHKPFAPSVLADRVAQLIERKGESGGDTLG